MAGSERRERTYRGTNHLKKKKKERAHSTNAEWTSSVCVCVCAYARVWVHKFWIRIIFLKEKNRANASYIGWQNSSKNITNNEWKLKFKKNDSNQWTCLTYRISCLQFLSGDWSTTAVTNHIKSTLFNHY